MALRVGLIAVGVVAGDEVVVPGLDWVAASAVVRSLGAAPVPVDVMIPDCTIDPDAVAAALTPHTRAVVATHLGGLPADAVTLQAICRDARIPLVEDAAQAMGAHLDGRPVGSFGHVAALSFGPGKVLDAGGGGMLVTSDEHLWREAVRLSQHPARQLLAGIPEPNMQVLEARMHSLVARHAVNLVPSLHDVVAQRRRACERVAAAASELGLGLPRVLDRADPVGRGLPVTGADSVEDSLTDAGLSASRLAGWVEVARLVSASRELPRCATALAEVRIVTPRTR
jgi:dTDP-4-amino-4,6-dideoxygalactose transaminase